MVIIPLLVIAIAVAPTAHTDKLEKCVEETGWCLTPDGKDQNDGTKTLSASSKEVCLSKCTDAYPYAKGCEWSGATCVLHTLAIGRGSGYHGYSCWVFSKCQQINGYWGEWNSYIPCSSTCGVGVQRRFRQCDDPAPSKGGRPCSGPSEQTTSCYVGQCPGTWGEWSSYGPCSKTCGYGVQIRTRSCGNSEASNGGSSCLGTNYQTKSCNGGKCPGGE